MAGDVRRDVRRKIPSVDSLLRSAPGSRAAAVLGRPLLKRMLAESLEEVRAAAAKGQGPPSNDEILARAFARASAISVGLTPVINATGVVLHTNLGRAPLPESAVRAVARGARGYTDLEVDRISGARSARAARAEAMLASLTGAPGALVVNNCAAALMLCLAALAKGKQVLVSRGELIEIGGEFRIPDILAAAGAKLVEVGTTNRTRAADYRRAMSERTGAILKVHPSNYRVVGFTSQATGSELANIASKQGVPFLYDVGSGLLDRERGFPADEPTVVGALAEGADLVTFSGDKLLGGPQAGCVVGRTDLVERMRRHPVARAVRVDKMQVAALEAVLRLHVRGRHDEIPTHEMIHATSEQLSRRAHSLAEAIGGDQEGARAHVTRCQSVVGGGSVPGGSLPSWGVTLAVRDAVAFAARLRTEPLSVFSRLDGDRVLLDVRTVTDDDIPQLARAVQYALEFDEVAED